MQAKDKRTDGNSIPINTKAGRLHHAERDKRKLKRKENSRAEEERMVMRTGLWIIQLKLSILLEHLLFLNTYMRKKTFLPIIF